MLLRGLRLGTSLETLLGTLIWGRLSKGLLLAGLLWAPVYAKAANTPTHCTPHLKDRVLVPCQFENMYFHLAQDSILRLVDAHNHIDTQLHWHARTKTQFCDDPGRQRGFENFGQASASWQNKSGFGHSKFLKCSQDRRPAELVFEASLPTRANKAHKNQDRQGLQVLKRSDEAFLARAYQNEELFLSLPHHIWTLHQPDGWHTLQNVYNFSSQAQVLLTDDGSLDFIIDNQSDKTYTLHLYGNGLFISNHLSLLHALEIPPRYKTRIHFKANHAGALFLHDHSLYHEAHVEGLDFHFQTSDPDHILPDWRENEGLDLSQYTTIHEVRADLQLSRSEQENIELDQTRHQAHRSANSKYEMMSDRNAQMALAGAHNIADSTRESVQQGHDGHIRMNFRKSHALTDRIELEVRPKYEHVHDFEFEFESALEYKFYPWWYIDVFYNYFGTPLGTRHRIGVGTVLTF